MCDACEARRTALRVAVVTSATPADDTTVVTDKELMGRFKPMSNGQLAEVLRAYSVARMETDQANRFRHWMIRLLQIELSDRGYCG